MIEFIPADESNRRKSLRSSSEYTIDKTIRAIKLNHYELKDVPLSVQ
jgi:hypothetical protein